MVINKSILLILSIILFVSNQQFTKNPFKKIIVLMMENHSYDNVLGLMEEPIGEVKGNEQCNWHKEKEYCQKGPSQYGTKPDPGHIFPEVQYQLFNTTDYPSDNSVEPNMGGFASDYALHFGDPQNVFDMFEPEQIPAITTLAREFTTYTRWFSSVPSQTNPNKVFMHAAQSGGNLFNCLGWYCSGWPMNARTIQNKLSEAGVSWSIHWQDWCEAMGISPMNQEYEKYIFDRDLQDFYEKLANHDLDDYTYLIPRIVGDKYIDEDGNYVRLPPNTQHPSEDMRQGEELIKKVYEEFRKSPHWEDTLLLIVYDEHGGFYDHIVPPMNVTNPNPEEPSGPLGWEFTFERLGLRVPAIAISPWMKKTTESMQLEHSSIPKTIHHLFNLTSDYLTSRDAQANQFLNDNVILDEMREDCPMTLPEIPPYDQKNPRKESMEENELNGNPKVQLQLFGTMLVQKGILNPIKFKTIFENVHNDKQAMQFAKEAQYLLGYRKLHTVDQFQYLKQYVKEIVE